MNDLGQIVIRASHDVLPAVVDKLQAGIRTNSVNPVYEGGRGEGDFQTLIAGELDRLDCRVDISEPDAEGLVAFSPNILPFIPAAGFQGRPNIIGLVPSADRSDRRRAHLILNSHADTVAPGEISAWRSPPFDATVIEGGIHGLGAADAKGCLYAFLGALMVLKATRVQLQRGVVFQCVVDEEAGGAGTMDCIRRGYTAGAAIVGEPTSLKVCPGSRGSMSLTLRVSGRKAHPGEAWRGVNAIHSAWRYIETLEHLRSELDRTHMNSLWSPLPMGRVWGLMAVNSGPPGTAVPHRCDVHYNVGLIGTDRVAELQQIIETTLARVTASDNWLREHPPEMTWSKKFYEPSFADPNHPAVNAMIAAGADLGEHPVAEALSAVTDARHLINNAEIPAINFGPGDLHTCHTAQEVLLVEDLRRAIAWLAIFMIRYCGVARGPAE